MTTLKSNNNRLTSALQESTANVDEWKRQLHTYKEENLRLKREMDAMKPSGGAAGKNTANEANEEMRIENIRLNSQLLSMEKEINEYELKTSKSNIREKSNEQSVSWGNRLPVSFIQIQIINFHFRVHFRVSVQAIPRSIGQTVESIGRPVQCATRDGESVAGA